MKKIITLLIMTFILTSISAQSKANLYSFDGVVINLDLLKKVNKKEINESNDFKKSSPFAHRFEQKIKDSLTIDNKIFTIINDEDNKEYALKIEENNTTKKIPLPVESPLPEVYNYSIFFFQFNQNIIVILSDYYDTKYSIVKYDLEGKQILLSEIEHTYITHPEENTNHHHRYLYFSEVTNSEIIFTSHMAFADKLETILLNMNDFCIKKYDKMSHGVIINDNTKEFEGFITEKDNNYELTMKSGDSYNLKLETSGSYNLLLKDNLLYIANFHPISTGSSLYCFDLKQNKIIWEADVLQVNANHSEYWNNVIISMYEDKLIMEGNEANGNYLQFFNPKTGQRIADFGIPDFSKFE